MSKFRIALVAVVAIVALAACSAPIAKGAAVPPAPAAASTSAAPAAPTTVAFGAAQTYKDGLSITVKPTGAGQATAMAAGAEASAGKTFGFDVTLTNGTKVVFDPALVQGSVTYGAAGKVAGAVFDSPDSISTGNFTGAIAPGQSQTVHFTWAIPTDGLGQVTYVVTPSFEHAKTIFTGALA